jgi:hypothetical protein
MSRINGHCPLYIHIETPLFKAVKDKSFLHDLPGSTASNLEGWTRKPFALSTEKLEKTIVYVSGNTDQIRDTMPINSEIQRLPRLDTRIWNVLQLHVHTNLFKDQDPLVVRIFYFWFSQTLFDSNVFPLDGRFPLKLYIYALYYWSFGLRACHLAEAEVLTGLSDMNWLYWCLASWPSLDVESMFFSYF